MAKNQPILENTQPFWIGFINEKDMKLESVYTIYRKRMNNEITFHGEKYRIVNSEWGCYIKESEYNKLFN